MEFRNDILFKIVATPFIYARLDFSQKGGLPPVRRYPALTWAAYGGIVNRAAGSLSLDANLPHGAGIERIGPAR